MQATARGQHREFRGQPGTMVERHHSGSQAQNTNKKAKNRPLTPKEKTDNQIAELNRTISRQNTYAAHLQEKIRHLEQPLKKIEKIKKIETLESLKVLNATFSVLATELNSLKRVIALPKTTQQFIYTELQNIDNKLKSAKKEHILDKEKEVESVFNRLGPVRCNEGDKAPARKELRKDMIQVWSALCTQKSKLQSDIDLLIKEQDSKVILPSIENLHAALKTDSATIANYKTTSKHIISGLAYYYIDKSNKEGIEEIKRDYMKFKQMADTHHEKAVELEGKFKLLIEKFKTHKDATLFRELAKGDEAQIAKNVNFVAQTALEIETAEKKLYKPLVNAWELFLQTHTTLQTELAILKATIYPKGKPEELAAAKYLYVPTTVTLANDKKLHFRPAAVY